VFPSEVQGGAAKATHAGLPWLRGVKIAVGREVHSWPFDGWKVPQGRSVIGEAYPSPVRNRYP
jgi:hypothetical protein